jgi:glycosyltransferase involved in cell wall biosynthesis
MKILLTADPELPVPPFLYGGIERIVYSLIESYVRLGHDVTLCANPDSKVPCRLVAWPGKKSKNRYDIFRNTATLSLLIYKEHFDVLHSFSRLAYMTTIFPTMVPKVMSYQREPTVQQIRRALMLSKKDTMVFTGCSNYITNQLKTVASAFTIYNCVPVDSYTYKQKVELDAPLMFLGRIEEIKGTHIAIEVAKKTNRRLIIAGNIPLGQESYFEHRIKPHLNEYIIYVGEVNDKQKSEFLGKCLAFLMPIQWNEPFGIVMAEAMACGTPVLGFPMGSVTEVIEDGINGFICKDVSEMARRVNDCNQLDRETVRKIAEQRFSSEVIAGNYLRLYQNLIEKTRKI